MQKKHFALLAFLLTLTLVLIGCSDQLQLEILQKKNQVDQAAEAVKGELARGRETLTTMPSDSPERAKIVDATKKLEEQVARFQEISAQAESLLTALSNGQVPPPGALDALRKIPGIGPYADLILLLGSIGYGLQQRTKRNKAVEVITQAWTAESPAGPSDAMIAAKKTLGLPD
jgi:hypothetical protein